MECRLQWFTAASAGYLTDWGEEMYQLQFGVERLCPHTDASHALYLELGLTNLDDSFQIDDTPQNIFTFVPLDIEVEIVPLTLNYKYEKPFSEKLSWYAGLGLGIAMVDLDISTPTISEGFDDTVFYGQVFTGLVYNVNESFEVFGGARYIFMDDPELTGFSSIDEKASIDGDVLLELGVRYNF